MVPSGSDRKLGGFNSAITALIGTLNQIIRRKHGNRYTHLERSSECAVCIALLQECCAVVKAKTEVKSSGLWLRSLAAIIDGAIVLCLWCLIIAKWGTSITGGRELTGIPGMLLIIGVAAYWMVPEWLAEATFGKWCCDLRVTTLNGSKISFSQSAKRNVLRLVDFFPWYLTGFIAAKLSPRRQRLGDLWARTIVVSCSEINRQRSAVATSPGLQH
jgi:uncharacterized RDD family membrane protein YckC